MNHFLADAVLHVAGTGMDQVDAVAQELHRVAEGARRLRLHEEFQLGGEFIDGPKPEGHRHAAARAQSIDRDGEGRGSAVDRGILEKQSLATAGRLHLTIGQLRDLELGGDRGADALQLSGRLKGLQEIAVGGVGHGVSAQRMPSRFPKVTKKIAQGTIAWMMDAHREFPGRSLEL